MTLDEMTARGYTMTKRQIAELSRTLLRDYKVTLELLRDDMRKLYANMAGLKPEQYYGYVLKFDRLAKLEKTMVGQYNRLAKNINGTVLCIG